MEIRGTTRLIAVFGDPVSHSLSPSIHNPALAHYGLDYAYVPLHVRPADLGKAVDALRAFSFRGANCTIPHKLAVIPHLDGISEISKLMGAVNTIVNDDGRLTGTTTDPEGFLEGFREAGHSFAGKSVAILGNGGSARTIAFALLTMDKPARILMVARDQAKSAALAREIAGKLPGVPAPEPIDLARYSDVRKEVDVIVNATSVGMQPKADASPLPGPDLVEGQVVYDIVYAPERTLLLREAEARGLKTVGGLAMLVHQGRASFKLWTGVEPAAELFYRGARARLQKA